MCAKYFHLETALVHKYELFHICRLEKNFSKLFQSKTKECHCEIASKCTGTDCCRVISLLSTVNRLDAIKLSSVFCDIIHRMPHGKSITPLSCKKKRSILNVDCKPRRSTLFFLSGHMPILINKWH